MAETLLDGLQRREAEAAGRTFFEQNNSRIHGWIMEQAKEGDRLNRSDPLFNDMDENMRYVMGDQLLGSRPPYVPRVVVNETKRTVRIHASALTDIRPLFAWRVANPLFADQSAALNQLLIVWWVSRFVDLSLCDVIKYGLAAGSGDGLLEFDTSLPGGGDSVLHPRDPRDTLPIRPSHSPRIQEWGGVVLRQEVDPAKLLAKYPDRGAMILSAAGSTSKLGQLWTRFLRAVVSTTPGTLDGLSRPRSGPPLPTGGVITYNAYFKDPSINKNTHNVLMGPPSSNYSYMVLPGMPLYPRGRLVLAIENGVVYDGPNPYWHGMFPVARFSPDPWPWSFFGLPITKDMRPLQNGINTTVNDLLMNLGQHINRGTLWDSTTSDAVIKRFDPREPNYKVRVNMRYGDMWKLAEVAAAPNWALPFLQLLFDKFNEIGETENFQQLLNLRQVPSGDTLERYQNALTPGIRMEGRYLEYFLRDLAYMLLCNIFQFYSAKRRYALIGEAGQVLADVDYDPETMIPGLISGSEGYTPELDASLPRDVRAQFFKGLFTFYVAPNSLLAMNAQEQKMMYMQLARMGCVDYWTLMEKLEIPNVGQPPPIPTPVPGAQPMPQLMPDPTTGVTTLQMVPPMEMKVPVTITEKLQAQQMLGIGMTVSPAGRKASGQAPPKMEKKGDRTTITESK